MRWFFALISLVLLLAGSAQAWIHGAGVTCAVTKNINTDFAAVGSGLVNDSPPYVSATPNFLDYAVNTFQPANPGQTICLTQVAGDRYFFGTFAQALFEGITNLVVNGNGATSTNALNLTATSSAAGQAVLTFSASVPSGVTTGMPVIDDTNNSALDGTLSVQALGPGANQVTLNGNISAPGVATNDVISFKGGGAFFGTAGAGQDPSGINFVPIQTVSAGATSVTAVTASDASKFTVGTWTVVTGIDLQGGGQPVNQWFHEYAKITGTNAVTGVITLQSPLKFSYNTNWPSDQGGPAATWVLPTTWEVNQTYNNVSSIGWDGPGNTLLNANGRTITFNNSTFPIFGPNISFQQTFTCTGCSVQNTLSEVDKLWEVANINGGTWAGFTFFSGTANDVLTLNGVNVTQATIGSPGVLNITNSTLVGLKPGAQANGITTKISCSNSNLGTAGIYDYAGVSDTTITAANGVTINSSGLITIPRSVDLPVRWAVPGADAYFGNTDTFWGLPFSVVSVSGDATNTYVQTNLSGYTTLPGSGVRAAPAGTINFVNCTGSSSVLDWSQAGAQNQRPGTYSNRIYTCTNGIAAQQALHPGVPVIDLNNTPTTDPRMMRALKTVTVAVSQADSGASVNWQMGGQFNNGKVYDSTNTGSTWAPIINLNTVGTRTYDGTTNTWSGGVAGDTLSTTTPGFPSYIGGTFAFVPFTSRSVSGETAGACPIVTLTIQTTALERRDLGPFSASSPLTEHMQS